MSLDPDPSGRGADKVETGDWPSNPPERPGRDGRTLLQ